MGKGRNKELVMSVLHRYPFGLNQAEICRFLNGKALDNENLVNPCAKCVDYANPNKRYVKYKGEIFKPTCKPRYRSLRNSISLLVKQKLVTKTREKRRDPFMNRGWDYFNVVRPNAI